MPVPLTQDAWEYRSNALDKGTGTVFSYDIETIGDVLRNENDLAEATDGTLRTTKGHIRDVVDDAGKIAKTVRSQYDGFAGITELGLARGVVDDAGAMVKTNFDFVTFAVPMSAGQVSSAYSVLEKYKLK